MFLQFNSKFCFNKNIVLILLHNDVGRTETYAGVLLQFVQEVLGRNKVVQQVAKTVMLIRRLQDGEDLHGNVTRGGEAL